MKELFSYCWRSIVDRGMFVRYVVACFLQALLGLATPFLVGSAINSLLAGGAGAGAAGVLCALVAALGTSSALAGYRGTLLYTYLQADSSFQLDVTATMHIQRLRPAFFEGFDPSFWRKRLDTDTNDLTVFFLQSVTGLIQNGGSLAVTVAILAAIDWRLSLVCAALAVATGLLYGAFGERIHAANSDFMEDLSGYSACMLSQLRDAPFVRRHPLFGWSESRMREAYTPLRSSMYEANMVGGRFSLASGLAGAVALGLLLWVSVVEVSSGRMAAGFVATAYGYFSTMTSSVESLAGFGHDYQSARVNYEHLRDLAAEPEEPRGEAVPEHVGEIAVEGLTATHPGSERVLLGGLTHTFERGRVYGVAGPNGCGKSTLMDVLTGLLEGCRSGRVSYDGVPLESVDQYALRERTVAFVEQAPEMVKGTLRDNVSLLAPGADRVEAERLLRRLGAERLVREDGLDRPVTGGDGGLSGGERQKVAIARALLKRPDVVVLDEPTAALDEDGRRDVEELLRTLRSDHVTFLVTHDDGLLAQCDEVVRLGE